MDGLTAPAMVVIPARARSPWLNQAWRVNDTCSTRDSGVTPGGETQLDTVRFQDGFASCFLDTEEGRHWGEAPAAPKTRLRQGSRQKTGRLPGTVGKGQGQQDWVKVQERISQLKSPQKHPSNRRHVSPCVSLYQTRINIYMNKKENIHKFKRRRLHHLQVSI